MSVKVHPGAGASPVLQARPNLSKPLPSVPQKDPAPQQSTSKPQDFNELQIRATRRALEEIRFVYENLSETFLIVLKDKRVVAKAEHFEGINSKIIDSEIPTTFDKTKNTIKTAFTATQPNENPKEYKFFARSEAVMRGDVLRCWKATMDIDFCDGNLQATHEKVVKLYNESKELYSFYTSVLNGLTHLFFPGNEEIKKASKELKVEEIKGRICSFTDLPNESYTKEVFSKQPNPFIEAVLLKAVETIGREAFALCPNFNNDAQLKGWTVDKIKRIVTVQYKT